MPAQNKLTTFSIGAISVETYPDLSFVVDATVPGSLEIPLTRPIVATMGGPSQFAVGARAGRFEGEGKLMIRATLPVLEAISMGAVINPPVVSGSAVFSAFADTTPTTTIAGNFTLAATAGRTQYKGRVYVTWVSDGTTADTAKVRVSVTSSNGSVTDLEIDNVGSGALAKPIPKIGASLAYSDTSTVAAGDSGVAEVSPAGTETKVSVPVNTKDAHYGLRCYTLGNGVDKVKEVYLKRIQFGGYTEKATDNEATSDMEFGFTIVQPDDESDAVEINHIEV